jgi:hypothetical protein
MAAKITKIVKQVLAHPSVSIDPTDYTIETDDTLNVCITDGWPGVALRITTPDGRSRFYECNAQEGEDHYDEITYAEVRAMGLTAMLDADYRDEPDDAKVEYEHLHPDLQQHMLDSMSAEDVACERAMARAYADAAIDRAKVYIAHSPRGFDNELQLYSVSKDELAGAKKWIAANVPNNSRNWWRVWSAERAHREVCASYYDSNHRDSLVRERATMLTLRDWSDAAAETVKS